MINCTFENGNSASPGLRHVTVGVIAFNLDGKIALVKRGPTVPAPNKYSVPGGFLDRKETTAEGAMRELKEETGLDGEIEALFHVNDNPNRPKEDRQNVDFIYLVKVTSADVKTDWETLSVEWFGKDSLPAEDDFAFDHRAVILKFFEYQEKEFTLPLVGKL